MPDHKTGMIDLWVPWAHFQDLWPSWARKRQFQARPWWWLSMCTPLRAYCDWLARMQAGSIPSAYARRGVKAIWRSRRCGIARQLEYLSMRNMLC